MAQEVRAHTEAGPLPQGLADMAQSWSRLARDLVPQVPELPGLIEQAVGALDGREITEESLSAAARSITSRVEEAGFSEEASQLLRRMGRAMYELLLVIATQEELRAMGMLLAVTPGVAPAPPAPANGKTQLPPPANAASAPPTAPSQGGAKGPAPAAEAATAPRARPPASPAASNAPKPAPAPRPAAQAAAARAQSAAPAGTRPSAGPRVPVVVPPMPQPPTPGPAATQKPAAPPASPPPAVADVPGQPPPGGDPAKATAEAAPAPPAQSPAAPSGPGSADAGVVESALWGFDPSARQPEEAEPVPSGAPATEPTEPAIAVEATVAQPAAAPPPAGLAAPRPAGGVWRVRLSPKAAEARERKVEARHGELRPLVEEVIQQVHGQRREVSDRGPARQAVHAAADIGAPADLGLASAQLDDLLEAGQLERAAALALRVTEAFPGESSAELACRAGEASRDAKQDDLAILCLTTAVLAAPPFEQACWQLAGMALEGRDPKLAPIWLELVARLLRVRGADEDAVVVYRQLINLCPRREDVREILRSASLTGSLPG